jgi:hypothetical protein
MADTKTGKRIILMLFGAGAVLLAFVLLMYVINVCLPGPDGDKGVVDKKAREVFFWKDLPISLMPSSVTVYERHDTFFQNHTLYGAYYDIFPLTIVFPGDLDQAIIALGDDHTAYFLPGEYNEMIKGEDVRVDSGEKALQAAELYINSTSVYGEVRILYNISDIPGLSDADRAYPDNISRVYPSDKSFWYNESNAQYEQMTKIFTPPVVSMDGSMYVAEFDSWKSIGGDVESWKVRVDENGAITVINDTTMCDWIGHCYGLAL